MYEQTINIKNELPKIGSSGNYLLSLEIISLIAVAAVASGLISDGIIILVD